MEEDRYRLLKAIHERGSLKSAAAEMGVSYRKAWGDLKKAEELLGYELVIRQRGGRDGGASSLTEKAIKLLEAYEALHMKLDDAVEKAYDDFKAKIKPGK